MKGKEFYVVIVDNIYDYESNVECFGFASIDDARTKLETLKDNAVEENDDYVLEEWEDGFSYYKDGEYSVDHYDVRIEKQVIL